MQGVQCPKTRTQIYPDKKRISVNLPKPLKLLG